MSVNAQDDTSYSLCDLPASSMEPGSILGAAASAATVIELCTDSLNALLRLQRKYKNADLTARLLLTQLSTLRAALSEISNWLDNGRHSCLASVFTDLTTSLDGCKYLIEHLNQRLSDMNFGKAKPMSFLDKTRAIWGENERTEFLALLGHNIAALQLLLTAMQWYAPIAVMSQCVRLLTPT